MVDPDAVLLEAVGRGEREAFESLIRQYQGRVVNFIARYLGDRYAAEDLAQEAFLRVYRAAPRFEPKTRVSTWIFRIAYNLVLTEIKHRKRRESLGKALSRDGEDGCEPFADASERYELEEEIESAVRKLAANQRAALLLRVNEGLSYREIGEILRTSVGSVESLLFRARRNVRRSLGREKK